MGKPERFYIPSLSSRTIVYKGMFVSPQFLPFYPDLSETDFESALAIVHQRYSTNTSPSWFLAQPFRIAAHNGEINTLRRNMNNMRAREASLASPLFGEDLARLLPVVAPGGSDSAVFDNVLELLTRGGRSLTHAMAMMVPEAFGTKYHISEDKRAFYEYHAAIMEPWDGPAAMAFSDGRVVGALLDRNGLRPARYLVTRGGTVLLASEVGVLEVDPAEVLEKGRLAPGRMLLVDTGQGRVLRDNELKSAISRRQPYRHWLEKNRILLKGLFGAPRPVALDRERLPALQRCFGYTREDLLAVIAPMAQNAQEPVGSMGDDTPPAVLSARPRLLFDYFRQLFAQVTNPPIDPYRESLVMSLMAFVGRERNLLEETPEHCRQLKLSHPILTNDDLEQLREAGLKDFPVVTVPILFPVEGPGTLERALQEACREAERRIDEGAAMLILSDRGAGPGQAAIPSLLAIGGVHHHLVRAGKRHLSALVIETGEAREVHHFACLIGFGASGVNPYLAFETIRDLQESGHLPGELSAQEAAENYITAVKKGLAKIMSKMGISTLRSYRGSQMLRSPGPGTAADGAGLRRRPLAHRGHRPGTGGAGEAGHARVRLRPAGRPVGPPPGGRAALRRGVPPAPGTGAAPVLRPDRRAAAARGAGGGLRGLRGLHGLGQRRPRQSLHPARPAAHPAGDPRAPGGGGAGRGHPEALRRLGHVLRLHQPRGPRSPGRGHEPPGRPQQFRGGGRGGSPLPDRRRAGQHQQQDQAGGLGPLRGDQRLPGERGGAADQDGPGGQARRRRAAARPQGRPGHRPGAPFHSRHHADLPAPAPRHLFHRGPGPADLRPEARQPAGPRLGQAGLGGGGGHGGRGRGQGPGRHGADQRGGRRHGGRPAHLHPPRRACPGSWAWPKPSRCSPHRGCAARCAWRWTAS